MEESIGLYANIMAEVKVRIEFILRIANAKVEMPALIGREICYLQLRMVCELIALGCLLLHGDIKAAQAKDITKSYKADDLMRRLEAMHADFYPRPSIPTDSDTGITHFEPHPGPYLTKEDLIELVRRSGNIVHRGNLRRLLKGQERVQAELPDVLEWAQKIISLLDKHLVIAKGHEHSVVCFMADASVGGQVRVLAARTASETPVPPA